MGKYSIKEVEVLSGIKAHTLRIWEQRYKVVDPMRTETNIRYYNDDQLRRLLNLALLNRSGYKISKLAGMSSDEVLALLNDVEETESPNDYYINALVNSMMVLDEIGFREGIDKALRVFSFEKFCIDIVFPFLSKIGILWSTGSINPAQEHFASNLLKRKIVWEIEKLPLVTDPKAKSFALFLPEGEFHEISLLISEFLVKRNECKSFYFGSSLPLNDLKEIIIHAKPDVLLTVMLMSKSDKVLNRNIEKISKVAKEKSVWIAGPPDTFQHLTLPSNCLYIKSLNHMVELLDSL